MAKYCDFVGGWAALLLGGFEVVDQLKQVGLAATAEIDERDPYAPATRGTVADLTQCAEGDRAGIDAHVHERIDFEAGQVGERQQTAAGAEVEDTAGLGQPRLELARCRIAAVLIAPGFAMLRRTMVAAHRDFNSHGSLPDRLTLQCIGCGGDEDIRQLRRAAIAVRRAAACCRLVPADVVRMK